jgi:hypothetical protein
MMTLTLTLSTGSFDQVNTFALEVLDYLKRPMTIRCSLVKGYKTEGDGIFWGMSSGCAVKSRYTEADIAEQRRLDAQVPVRNNDIVMIEGVSYRAKVNGEYSNAVVFEAL